MEHAPPPVQSRQPPAAATVSPTPRLSMSRAAAPLRRRMPSQPHTISAACTTASRSTQGASTPQPSPRRPPPPGAPPLPCITTYAAASFSVDTTERRSGWGVELEADECRPWKTHANAISSGCQSCVRRNARVKLFLYVYVRVMKGVFRGGPWGVMKKLFREDHGDAALLQ